MPLFAAGLLLGVCAAYGLPNPYLACLTVPVWLAQKRPWTSGLLLGSCWMTLHLVWHQSHQLPEALLMQPIEIEGRINSIPTRYTTHTSFDFTVSRVLPPNSWPKPGNVRLKWVNPPDNLTVGDRWHLAVKLKKPHGFANPGSVNSEKFCFQNRQSATGFVLPHANVTKISSPWYSKPIDKLRQRLSSSITQNDSENKFLAIILAMTVGDKTGITQEQWRVFQATGTAHLMAISGLHIGLMALLGFFLARKVGFGLRLATAISLGVAGLYALLAGLSVPTQRAFLMTCALMVGILTRRKVSPYKGFSLALIVVLFLDPFSITSLGFWLSFGAVGVLLYGLQERRGWGKAQWVVFVGLLPLTVLGFGQVALISPIANTVAIPWVSFLVVPLALVGVLLSGMSAWLAEPFLRLSQWCLSGLWPILDWLSQYGFYETAPTGAFGVACAVLGVLLLLAPKGIPGKPISFIFFLPLFFPVVPKVQQGEFKMTVLDVGQGLASVIQTQHHCLVFDTGARYNDRVDCAKQVVLPYLRTQGIVTIDTLILSHLDNDHAGGAKTLLSAIPINRLLLNQLGRYTHYAEQLCQAGQQWKWDGVTFEILHPSPLYLNPKKNNQSCVLKISAGQNSVLFTGDIEQDAEAFLLLTQREQLNAKVLVVPHHGSDTSSSEDFIKAVNPEVGLIPVGYCNRYGHPNKKVIQRYKTLGIPLENTVEGGALTTVVSEQCVQEMKRFR